MKPEANFAFSGDFEDDNTLECDVCGEEWPADDLVYLIFTDLLVDPNEGWVCPKCLEKRYD